MDVESYMMGRRSGGSGGGSSQVETMPEPSAALAGKIVQYVGATTSSYTKGYFYECVASGSSYVWQQKNVQPGGGGGTDLDLSIVGGKLCVSFEEV